MKFEKNIMAAAALAAATECAGAGCVPALKAESAVARAPSAASLSNTETRRAETTQERLKEEVEQAIEGCVNAKEPAEFFARLPLHLKDLLLVQIAASTPEQTEPDFISRLKTRLRDDYAKEAEPLIRSGFFSANQDGLIDAIGKPEGFKAKLTRPLHHFEAIVAEQTAALSVGNKWSAAPEILSPFLVVGKDGLGKDVLRLKKGKAPSRSVPIRSRSGLAYLDEKGISYTATPSGLSIQEGGKKTDISGENGVILQTTTENPAGDDRTSIQWYIPKLDLHFISERSGDKTVYAEYSVADESSRISYDESTGKPKSAFHEFSGTQEGKVFFDKDGLPVVESPKAGEVRVLNEKGMVGTYSEEKAKKPGLTIEDYAKRLATGLRSPKHWEAFVESSFSSSRKIENKEMFDNDPRMFSLFVCEILKAQGVSAAAVEVPSIGVGVIWLVNRGKGNLDIFMLGQGLLLKNFDDIDSDSPSLPSLREAFLKAVNIYAREYSSKAGTMFDLWRNLDGTIEVLKKAEDGSIEKKSISLDEITN
ncbi:MAG: hypothetical protein RDU25_02000 [Patescibacteria group bacterium]|nr:hypothetical protein [Patescibacteria group bacterium]